MDNELKTMHIRGIDPEDHHAFQKAALDARTSLNAWALKALQREAERQGKRAAFWEGVSPQSSML